ALGARPDIGHVEIFENRGEVMGCSNPHPHGQIWAQRSVPMLVQREGERQAEYLAWHRRSLLADYLAMETEREERIVCANDHFVGVVPSLAALDDAERDGLADLLKRLTGRYDNLFGVPFPYSAGFHQAPTDGAPHPEWHLHMHFFPPLLRSATVRKF